MNKIVYIYRRLFTKCEYFSVCRYKDRESETCLCGGGQHCGYWKELYHDWKGKYVDTTGEEDD